MTNAPSRFAPRVLALTCVALTAQAATAQVRVNVITPFGLPPTQPSLDSYQVSLSSTGRFVAFASLADDLDAMDANETYDVFFHDRDRDADGILDETHPNATRTKLVSRQTLLLTTPIAISFSGNGPSTCPMISGDGRKIVFQSEATDLIVTEIDANGSMPDIFVYTVANRHMVRVSVDSSNQQGAFGSYEPSINDAGYLVAFRSANSFAVAPPNREEVFVHDLLVGSTIWWSPPAPGVSRRPRLSGDGQWMTFMRQHTSGTVLCVQSVTSGATALTVDGPLDFPSLSDDGARVACEETQAPATRVYDVPSQTLVATVPGTSRPRLSGDGGWIACLRPDGRAHLVDVVHDTNAPMDFGNGASVVPYVAGDIDGCGELVPPDVSLDGKVVAFYSTSDDLDPTDTNGVQDIFVLDRRSTPTTMAFCDDFDGSLASCPCGAGAGNTGCDIAQGTGGVRLAVLAQAASPSNRATLAATGFPPAAAPIATLVRSATLQTPVVFGDGLRCVGTPVVRLASASASGGATSHVVGHGSSVGGGTFYYQAWLRNTPQSFCDPTAVFNMSSGAAVSW